MGQMDMPLQSGLESLDPTLLSSKLTFGRLSGCTHADWFFFFLFLFRYARFVVHAITGIFLYKPSPEMPKPRYTGHDTAVIVPTVDPTAKEFYRCLESILQNLPHLLIIVTVGHLATVVERLSVENMRSQYPATKICTLKSRVPNKRKQILLGLENIEFHRTHRRDIPVVVFVDDQVSWGPRFLPSLLAAFEDPKVGLVGTNKKACGSTCESRCGKLEEKRLTYQPYSKRSSGGKAFHSSRTTPTSSWPVSTSVDTTSRYDPSIMWMVPCLWCRDGPARCGLNLLETQPLVPGTRTNCTASAS